MTLVEIRNLFYSRWTSEDGLALLLGPDKKDCDNDNGILFLAYFVFAYAHCSNDDLGFERIWTLRAIAKLENEPGLYNRRPGFRGQEALDNYTAIAAISALLETRHADDICSYGRKHYWMFDNKSPKKFAWTNLRQPGDTGFYKMCSYDENPSILEIGWFIGGVLLHFFQNPTKNTSVTLMHWIRLEAVTRVYPDGYYATLKQLWLQRIDSYGGLSNILRIYFEPSNDKHPLILIGKHLDQRKER